MSALTVVRLLRRLWVEASLVASEPAGDAIVVSFNGKPYRVVVYELSGHVHD